MVTYNVTCTTKPWIIKLVIDPYVKLVFDQSAEFRVLLYAENDIQCGVENILLDGVNYEQWTFDEPYIKQFILSHLNCEEVES